MIKAGITSLRITSVAGTPKEQARAMYNNIKKGLQCNYKTPGRIVQSLYPDLEAMTKEIYKQGPGNVSRHCADYKRLNVIDIAPSSVSNKLLFHNALMNNRNISKVLDPFTKSIDPVFHIEIPQF